MIINKNTILKTYLLLILSIIILGQCAIKQVSTKDENKLVINDTIKEIKKEGSEFYVESSIRYNNHVYNENIHSIFIHKTGTEISEPYITLNSNEQLILRFDELNAEFNSYQYQLIHCDANWEPSQINEMDYIEGFNDNYFENMEKSFNTQQPYVHYWAVFPNENTQLLISGNYIVKAYQENDIDHPIFTQKFYVAEQLLIPEINIKYPSDVEQKYYRQEIDFNFIYNPQKIINPYSNIRLFLEQNHRTDNQKINLEPNFIRDNKLVYNYDEDNVFDGGHEFRHVDLSTFQSNTDRVASTKLTDKGYKVMVMPDEKRTYKRYLEKRDINGKFLIKTIDGNNWNTEGDYAKVLFTLPYREILDQGDIYIFGQLSNWKIDPKFQLKYNAATDVYQKEVYLKQGYYNYLYLYVNDTTQQADVRLIEGSHFDTENEYIFKVYYKDPGDFYDRLLLYHVANSRKSF